MQNKTLRPQIFYYFPLACMSSPKIFRLIQVQPCLGLLCHLHMTKSMHKHACMHVGVCQCKLTLCCAHHMIIIYIRLQTPRLHRAKPACLFHPLAFAYMHTHWEQLRSSEKYISMFFTFKCKFLFLLAIFEQA